MQGLMGNGGGVQPSRRQFEAELQVLIEEHISFPSIVMYVIFNEGWGQYETQRVTRAAMALDPSRLYNCASGWCGAHRRCAPAAALAAHVWQAPRVHSKCVP